MSNISDIYSYIVEAKCVIRSILIGDKLGLQRWLELPFLVYANKADRIIVTSAASALDSQACNFD